MDAIGSPGWKCRKGTVLGLRSGVLGFGVVAALAEAAAAQVSEQEDAVAAVLPLHVCAPPATFEKR